MKKGLFILGFLAFAICARSAMAAGVDVESKFFTKQKIYTEDNYVLNDYLEFSVFDMSKLNLFINSQKIDLKPVAPTPMQTTITTTSLYVDPKQPLASLAQPQTPPVESDAEKEIREILPEIPKYFYKNLKQQIVLNKIPLTLYATDSPAYAKPIKLYVKLKKISLGAKYTDKKGNTLQPVGIKIYGQLKEKGTDKLLTRFYDTEFTEYAPGTAQVKQAFDVMANKMMNDLTQFLKTKY